MCELRIVGYRWADSADEVLCRDCWWRAATSADPNDHPEPMADVRSSERFWRLMMCEECRRELGEAVDAEEASCNAG